MEVGAKSSFTRSGLAKDRENDDTALLFVDEGIESVHRNLKLLTG
jgi:hypothetical protein